MRRLSLVIASLLGLAWTFYLVLADAPVLRPAVGSPVVREAQGAPGASSALEGKPDVANQTGPGESQRAEVRSDPFPETGELLVLRGTVVQALRGTPVEGAAVTLSRGGQGELEGAGEQTKQSGAGADDRSTVSGEDGTFELLWPELWQAHLTVSHVDYVDLHRPAVDLEEVLRVELKSSGRIQGRVLARSAEVLEGATAELWVSHSGRIRGDVAAEVPVSGEGEFHFTDLPQGIYALGVVTTGAALAHEPTVQVNAGLTTQVVLTLEEGELLRGQVLVRGTSEPVEGAQILARPELQGIGDEVEGNAQREVQTSADGRFELEGLSPGSADLWVRTPWGELVHEEVAISSDGLPAEEKVLVSAPARLFGRVLDLSGEPISTGLVAWSVVYEAGRFDWASSLAVSSSQVGTPGAGGTALPGGPRLHTCIVDEQGRFDLKEVPAGQELQIAAYSAGPASSADLVITRLELKPGEERELDLVLLETTQVTGRVVGEDELPIAGATIRLELGGRRWRSQLLEGVTGSDGEYLFEQVPRAWVRLQAELEGYRGSDAWMDLRESEDGRVEDLTLRPAFVVSGHVVDTDGWAVPLARVGLRQLREDGERNRDRGRWESADRYGRFEIGGLLEGNYTVESWAIAHESSQVAPAVSLPGAPYVVLRMRPRDVPTPGEITGEISLAGSGGAVPGLEFRGVRGTVQLDGTRFKISGVTPGKVSLGARAPGREYLSFEEVILPEGGSVDVGRYETRSTTDVKVAVLTEGGKTLRGAKVRLLRRVKTPRRGVRVPGSYDLDFESRSGRYEQRGVGRYSWTLDVRREGYKDYSQAITVGASGDFQVQLSRGTNKQGSGKKQ